MNEPANGPKKSDLFFKLATILGEIKSVPKSGHNDYFNYDFVVENDLVNAVRDKLSAAGIFVFTSVESQEVRELVDGEGAKQKKSLLTLVTLKHTFCSAETGETFSVLSQGQGADLADKGAYKATTGAMKYFIYKNFMIPVGEDGAELERAPARREPAKNAAAGAGTRPAAGPSRDRSERLAAELSSPAFDWRAVEIHFGAYKGQKLGALSGNQLSAWFNWKPNPRYKKDEDGLLLRALELAAAEVNA